MTQNCAEVSADRTACAPNRIAAKRMMFPTAKPVHPSAEQPLAPTHMLRQRPSGLRLPQYTWPRQTRRPVTVRLIRQGASAVKLFEKASS